MEEQSEDERGVHVLTHGGKDGDKTTWLSMRCMVTCSEKDAVVAVEVDVAAVVVVKEEEEEEEEEEVDECVTLLKNFHCLFCPPLPPVVCNRFNCSCSAK